MSWGSFSIGGAVGLVVGLAIGFGLCLRLLSKMFPLDLWHR